jgi:membrane-associated phospholipid phosphatase
MSKSAKFLFSATILFALAIIISVFYFYTFPNKTLPTYFNYSATDYQALSNLESSNDMQLASLKKWDAIMFDLIKEYKLGDTNASQVYAYVYTAQRDAAFLSKNAKHTFMGNLDPVTAEVLCVFFSQSCPDIRVIKHKDDKYSEKLAELVLKKIQERIQKDKKNIHLFTEKKTANLYWKGVKPYYGQDVGSWKTWLINSSNEFVAPPIPDNNNSVFWNSQLKEVTTALQNITPEQTASVVFWAGNPSTITPPGIWLVYANDYMSKHHVNLTNTLYLRSILAMGIADSVIAAFNSKYTYWIKRPFLLDATIQTVMPTPNHPSYPAGHSTLSATAAVILSIYFPENTKQWKSLEFVASSGRVWGGIHFPIDAEQGIILGEKIGNAIVIKMPPLQNGK